jgi:hypothetical protein
MSVVFWGAVSSEQVTESLKRMHLPEEGQAPGALTMRRRTWHPLPNDEYADQHAELDVWAMTSAFEITVPAKSIVLTNVLNNLAGTRARDPYLLEDRGDVADVAENCDGVDELVTELAGADGSLFDALPEQASLALAIVRQSKSRLMSDSKRMPAVASRKRKQPDEDGFKYIPPRPYAAPQLALLCSAPGSGKTAVAIMAGLHAIGPGWDRWKTTFDQWRDQPWNADPLAARLRKYKDGKMISKLEERPFAGSSTKLARLAIFGTTQTTHGQWLAAVTNTVDRMSNDKPQIIEGRDALSDHYKKTHLHALGTVAVVVVEDMLNLYELRHQTDIGVPFFAIDEWAHHSYGWGGRRHKEEKFLSVGCILAMSASLNAGLKNLRTSQSNNVLKRLMFPQKALYSFNNKDSDHKDMIDLWRRVAVATVAPALQLHLSESALLVRKEIGSAPPSARIVNVRMLISMFSLLIAPRYRKFSHKPLELRAAVTEAAYSWSLESRNGLSRLGGQFPDAELSSTPAALPERRGGIPTEGCLSAMATTAACYAYFTHVGRLYRGDAAGSALYLTEAHRFAAMGETYLSALEAEEAQHPMGSAQIYQASASAASANAYRNNFDVELTQMSARIYNGFVQLDAAHPDKEYLATMTQAAMLQNVKNVFNQLTVHISTVKSAIKGTRCGECDARLKDVRSVRVCCGCSRFLCAKCTHANLDACNGNPPLSTERFRAKMCSGTSLTEPEALQWAFSECRPTSAHKVLVMGTENVWSRVQEAKGAMKAMDLQTWKSSEEAGMTFLNSEHGQNEELTGLDLAAAQAIIAIGRPWDEQQAYSRALRLNSKSEKLLIIRLLNFKEESKGLEMYEESRLPGQPSENPEAQWQPQPAPDFIRNVLTSSLRLDDWMLDGAEGSDDGDGSLFKAPENVRIDLVLASAAKRISEYVLPVGKCVSVSGDPASGHMRLELTVAPWHESLLPMDSDAEKLDCDVVLELALGQDGCLTATWLSPDRTPPRSRADLRVEGLRLVVKCPTENFQAEARTPQTNKGPLRAPKENQSDKSDQLDKSDQSDEEERFRADLAEKEELDRQESEYRDEQRVRKEFMDMQGSDSE